MQEKNTFCRICEPMCPLLAEVNEDGKVTQLRPNPNHPSGGTPCHKGLGWLNVHNDPDRLNYPLKRVNSKEESPAKFERISWDQALKEIADKIKTLQEEHGKNSITTYTGNPIAFSSYASVSVYPFAAALESEINFSAGTQDFFSRALICHAMFGGVWAYMIPDFANTDYLMVIGSNPTSHWTLMSVPNDGLRHLKAIKARGGKITFVNPRKLEASNESTGETIQVRPDTDAYFLVSLFHEIDKQGGIDHDYLNKYGKNVEPFFEFIREWPPERCAHVTGVSIETIKQTAADIVAAKSASFAISTGVHQGRQGTLCSWLFEMLSIATGNLGREGGNYKPTGVMEPMPSPTYCKHVETPDGVLPITAVGSLPAVLFPDMVDNGQVRAMLCFFGNPLMSMSGEDQMREAIKKLDLLVMSDILRNATSEMADYILPCTDWIEREDITSMGFMVGAQAKPHVCWTDALEPAAAERKNEWWIVSRLAQELGLDSQLDIEGHENGRMAINGMLSKFELDIEKLKALPNQTAMIPQEDKAELMEKWIMHEDKKIDCFPDVLEQGDFFNRFETILKQLEEEDPNILKLISMRTPYMHNSWMPNNEPLRKGTLATNKLRMSPEDAAIRQLFEGDFIRIYNQHGSIDAQLEIRADMRKGAVAMPHGFGHFAPDMSVANSKPGTNYNKLLPIGSKSYEPLSNMSWMCGVPVEVEKIIKIENAIV